MDEKPILTPENFLNDLGIKLETTTLVTVINEVMKQPDLCYLLETYWQAKFLEHKQTK